MSFPLALPVEPGFVEFVWAPDSAVAVQQAEFDLTTKVYVWPGKKRKFTARVGAMRTMQVAKAWQAFLAKLNGREGTFLANDPAGSVISGSFSLDDLDSSGLLVESAGSGSTFEVSGFPAGLDGALVAGDWVSVENRLYQLTDTADSDSSGVAELSVWPSPDGTLEVGTLVSAGPDSMGEFRLLYFPETVWNRERIMEEGLTIAAEESI